MQRLPQSRGCGADGVGMVWVRFPRRSPPAPCWQGPTGPGASSSQPRERSGAKGAPGERGDLWSHPCGRVGPQFFPLPNGKTPFFLTLSEL